MCPRSNPRGGIRRCLLFISFFQHLNMDLFTRPITCTHRAHTPTYDFVMRNWIISTFHSCSYMFKFSTGFDVWGYVGSKRVIFCNVQFFIIYILSDRINNKTTKFHLLLLNKYVFFLLITKFLSFFYILYPIRIYM